MPGSTGLTRTAVVLHTEAVQHPFIEGDKTETSVELSMHKTSNSSVS